jgi:hypothetical protein
VPNVVHPCRPRPIHFRDAHRCFVPTSLSYVTVHNLPTDIRKCDTQIILSLKFFKKQIESKKKY